MSPRTLTAPPTDRSMWRRLFALTHPDGAGDHELFVWARALYEHVAGDAYEDVRSTYQRREPPPHQAAGDRIDFGAFFERGDDFADLTARAVGMADSGAVEEPFASLLRLCRSAYPVTEADSVLYRAQHIGATYRQIAYIAHLAGMTKSQRTRFYRIAEEIPLAQAMAGHLIKELQARAGAA